MQNPLRVYVAVRDNPHITRAGVAEKLGVTVGAIRLVLRRLVAAGLVGEVWLPGKSAAVYCVAATPTIISLEDQPGEVVVPTVLAFHKARMKCRA